MYQGRGKGCVYLYVCVLESTLLCAHLYVCARLRGSDMKQPLKAKVNGLTVTCSWGLTLAHTQGESSTAASQPQCFCRKAKLTKLWLVCFRNFGGFISVQDTRSRLFLITVPHNDGFILRWWMVGDLFFFIHIVNIILGNICAVKQTSNTAMHLVCCFMIVKSSDGLINARSQMFICHIHKDLMWKKTR